MCSEQNCSNTHTNVLREQVSNLLNWHDALSDLLALERFLAEAVCLMAEQQQLGDVNHAQGLNVAFKELEQRLKQLKSEVSDSCSSLNQVAP